MGKQTLDDGAEEIRLGPQEGPQSLFYELECDIIFYGGHAGGGKSYGVILDPLKYVQKYPGYGAVIFRRTYPEIMEEGALWDTARSVYPWLGAISTGMKWIFPPYGNVVRFRHLNHVKDILKYMGSQIPCIMFDELTHFEYRMFWDLLSRNRSTCGVRPYIRATCNPAPGWVAEMIQWWWDPDSGYAIEERSGVVRYFVRPYDDLEWASTHEELAKRYPKLEADILSFTFILSKLEDNKILEEKDPGYRSKLQNLTLVERERLLYGNWLIKPAAGKLFNKAWVEVLEAIHIPENGDIVIYWDLAATERQQEGTSTIDPSYSAVQVIMRSGDIYYTLWADQFQFSPVETEKRFHATNALLFEDLQKWKPHHIRLRWEREPGSASKREASRLSAMYGMHDAKGHRVDEEKYLRAKPAQIAWEQQRWKILRGAWNSMYLNHHHNQPQAKNDLMDTTSGGHRILQKKTKRYSTRPGTGGSGDVPRRKDGKVDEFELNLRGRNGRKRSYRSNSKK